MMAIADYRCIIPMANYPQEYQDERISRDATNKLARSFTPLKYRVSFTCCNDES
jgi:hypothetical protein